MINKILNIVLFIVPVRNGIIVGDRGLSREKKKDGFTKRQTSLNPVPPVGMRSLSSDPMKVFHAFRAKRIEKDGGMKNETTKN